VLQYHSDILHSGILERKIVLCLQHHLDGVAKQKKIRDSTRTYRNNMNSFLSNRTVSYKIGKLLTIYYTYLLITLTYNALCQENIQDFLGLDF